MRTVSIIIPAYNSQNKILVLLEKVKKLTFPHLNKEIIVVDDCSRDNTYDIIKKVNGITVIHHEKNTGKGGALKTGLSAAKGDILCIQDDDLEYDPADITKIIQPILEKKSEIVFGSRRLNAEKSYTSSLYYAGGVLIDQIINYILKSGTTDAITGSKAFTKNVYKAILPIESHGFEIEGEIAAKAVKKGFKPYEVPISYNPRTHAEGKNIRWHHAFPILTSVIKYTWFS